MHHEFLFHLYKIFTEERTAQREDKSYRTMKMRDQTLKNAVNFIKKSKTDSL